MKAFISKISPLKVGLVAFSIGAGIFTYMLFMMFLNDYGSYDSAVGGRFGQFIVNAPFYFNVVVWIYAVFATHNILYATSYQKSKKAYMGNGLSFTILGFLEVLLSVVYLFNGTYSRIGGRINAIYPVDLIIYGLFFAFFGCFLYFYGQRFLKEKESYPQKSLKPVRLRPGRAFARGFYLVIALYMLGGLCFSFITFDTSFDHFAGMLGVYLAMALPWAALILYEFFYRSEPDWEKRKRKQWIYSTIILGSGLLLFAWIMIAEAADPNFLTESGSALFPLDHMLMESYAFGPFFALFPSLLGSLISLGKLTYAHFRHK